jgi:hypothetical protein
VTPTIWALVAIAVVLFVVGIRIAAALEAINRHLVEYLDAVSTYLHDIQGSLSDMAWGDGSAKPEKPE